MSYHLLNPQSIETFFWCIPSRVAGQGVPVMKHHKSVLALCDTLQHFTIVTLYECAALLYSIFKKYSRWLQLCVSSNCVVYLERWTSAQCGQGGTSELGRRVLRDAVCSLPFALWPLSHIGNPHALDHHQGMEDTHLDTPPSRACGAYYTKSGGGGAGATSSHLSWIPFAFCGIGHREVAHGCHALALLLHLGFCPWVHRHRGWGWCHRRIPVQWSWFNLHHRCWAGRRCGQWIGWSGWWQWIHHRRHPMWLSHRGPLRTKKIFCHAFNPLIDPLLFILDLRLDAFCP